jgi:prepilin-type N-terminal cleavage/methylation domain-containing protein
VNSRLSSPGIWPQEIRFFSKELSLLSPVRVQNLELPAGQMSSWSASYPGCGIYVCAGPGPLLARIGGEAYRLEAGDLVLVPVGTPVCWFAEKNPSSVLAALFIPSMICSDMDSSELASFFGSFQFGREKKLRIVALGREAFEFITTRLKTMLQGGTNSHGIGSFRQKVLLGEILLRILSPAKKNENPGTSLRSEEAWQRMPKVLEYLHKNYREDLYAEKIRKDLNLPEDYLATVFPEVMGQRWNRYLLDYRIRMAAGLLQPGSNRISSVAQDCGFSTLSHFNASFRKVMGMAPREFCSGLGRLPVDPDRNLGAHKKKNAAFTLVELLVTISIIGLLAGLAIPAIQAGRETAQVGGCMSNIRQLSTAILASAADNNGQIPSGAWANDAANNVTNGQLWTGGYVQDAKVFLCSHGRKSDPRWYGSPACHYSLNITPETSANTGIILNRIPSPSKAILLFEEDVNAAAKTVDSRALLSTNLPPGQGDNCLYTGPNHRKKGCISFYDGSAVSVTGLEWTNMLNTMAKRRAAFGVQ